MSDCTLVRECWDLETSVSALALRNRNVRAPEETSLLYVTCEEAATANGLLKTST